MQIDRRITNGLAWAGAVLVIAIPAADAALRQFGDTGAPQIAVVEEQPPTTPSAPIVPTPEMDAEPTVEPAPEPEVATTPQPKRDPVATASATPSVSGDDAVDSFLKSGRKLPSYISDGASEPLPAPAQVATTSPSSATALRETETAAPLPTRIVTFPTPVSERPAPVPRSALVQPPLVIEQPDIVVTAEDLEDWESGPLSEFLASRQAAPAPVAQDYDPDGFFLDEGPNSSARVTRFPRAYGYDEFAFE